MEQHQPGSPIRRPGVVYLVLDHEDGWGHWDAEVTPVEVPDPHVNYGHDLLVGTDGMIERVKHGPLVSIEGDIGGANIASLARAVRAPRCCSLTPEDIHVALGPGPLNIDLPNIDESFLIRVDDVAVSAVVSESLPKRPDEDEHRFAETLRPVATNYGCDIRRVRYLTSDGTTTFKDFVAEHSGYPDTDAEWQRALIETLDEMVCHIEIELITSESEDVQHLINAARALAAYLSARRGGKLAGATIVDLLRAKHVKLLLGQRETGFLEVKSQQYNLSAPGSAGERQKIELAQDVARFANSDIDAVLVIGYTEALINGALCIDAVKPISLADVDVQRYEQTLDSRIVPAIRGLVVETVDLENGSGLIFIYVPRQPEELQPYLVHGAIAGDKIEGAFISIVQRRGEGSTTLTAGQIHGYLVAGKAFLRSR